MDASKQVVVAFRRTYGQNPAKLKLVDGFLVCALSTAALQFLYLLVVGSFPFNAFMAGFFCCLGVFVFTVCLRLQTDPENAGEFELSAERAFGDYCFATLTLFLIAWNFVG